MLPSYREQGTNCANQGGWEEKESWTKENADISQAAVSRGDMTAPMCLRHPELYLYPSQLSPEFI